VNVVASGAVPLVADAVLAADSAGATMTVVWATAVCCPSFTVNVAV
jgi:hypothetical protein